MKELTLRDGDVIRCYYDNYYQNGDFVQTHNYEYEKASQSGFGFINVLGNFRSVDTENIRGDFSRTKWRDGFKIELRPMKGCEQTAHKCLIKKDGVAIHSLLKCTSVCENEKIGNL